jgi:hypothetical protein
MLLARPSLDPLALQEVATTLEQFLQTASLGEYQARLAMVASFRWEKATPIHYIVLSVPVIHSVRSKTFRS